MFGKAQQLNTQIAQAVFGQVPSGWTSATVTAKIISSHAEMQSRYVPEGGGPELSFDEGDEAYDLFEELREAMYEEVGAAWYVATLSLTAEGQFKFQYDYEDTSQFELKPSAAALADDLKSFPRSRTEPEES